MIYLIISLPPALGGLSHLHQLSNRGTAISNEAVTQILSATRHQETLTSCLESKIELWKGIAGITEDWQLLADNTVAKDNLYAWLERLTHAKDFQTAQTSLVDVTCKILKTLHEDPNYFMQFANIIAGDLSDCEDRAAMSLNLAYASWELYMAEQEQNITKWTDTIVRYGRTLKFRTLIQEMYAGYAENVEKLLYAEIQLGKQLNLLSIIQNMSYEEHYGKISPEELNAIYTLMSNVSNAECLCDLEPWRNFLRKRKPNEMQAIDAAVEASEKVYKNTALKRLEKESKVAEIERDKENQILKLTESYLAELAKKALITRT